MPFRDRVDAGRRLGALLAQRPPARPVVIGLPRGGVPVARAVADALGAPLDVIVARKLGVPGHEELGLGAIAEGGVVVFNDDVLRTCGATSADVDAAIARESAVLRDRVERIRAVHPMVSLTGHTAIVVDDGVATGITARAACRVARARGADAVWLATPVAPTDWRHRLAGAADEYLAVEEAADFGAVGWFYDDFPQVSDAEVLACLG